MKGWQTASQIIDEALFLVQDMAKTRWHEAVMYFMRTIRDYELFHNTSFSQTWLPISSIGTIALPDDCLEFISVGVSINGEIFTFTKSDKMAMPSAPIRNKVVNDRGEEGLLSITPQSGSSTKGLNQEGYFAVDLKNNRVALKQAFLDYYTASQKTSVLVSYKGTGVNDVNTSYFPQKAVNMLTSKIAYDLTMSDPKSTPFIVQTRRSEWEKDALRYDALSLPSADELLDAIYATASLSLRR